MQQTTRDAFWKLSPYGVRESLEHELVLLREERTEVFHEILGQAKMGIQLPMTHPVMVKWRGLSDEMEAVKLRLFYLQ